MMCFYSMLVLSGFREKGKYRRVGIAKYEYLHALTDREEAGRFSLDHVHTVGSITIV